MERAGGGGKLGFVGEDPKSWHFVRNDQNVGHFAASFYGLDSLGSRLHGSGRTKNRRSQRNETVRVYVQPRGPQLRNRYEAGLFLGAISAHCISKSPTMCYGPKFSVFAAIEVAFS